LLFTCKTSGDDHYTDEEEEEEKGRTKTKSTAMALVYSSSSAVTDFSPCAP
jgi:hypothetical protein